jgi:hypothetical protein
VFGLRECYKWLLCPVQENPTDTKFDIEALHAGWPEEVAKDTVVASPMLREQAGQLHGYLRLDFIRDAARVVQR